MSTMNKECSASLTLHLQSTAIRPGHACSPPLLGSCVRSEKEHSMPQLTMAMPICGAYHLHFWYATARDVTALEGSFQAFLEYSITLLCRIGFFQTVSSNCPVRWPLTAVPDDSCLKKKLSSKAVRSSTDPQRDVEEHHSVGLG